MHAAARVALVEGDGISFEVDDDEARCLNFNDISVKDEVTSLSGGTTWRVNLK